jgi:glycosyltransferase involved in cell wall biosynthesis
VPNSFTVQSGKPQAASPAETISSDSLEFRHRVRYSKIVATVASNSDKRFGSDLSAASQLPRISLVTPVFNSAKYIEQTIQSVLSQNYPNLEYFIIDGGSTDGTIDIIRKYEAQLSGWLSEPDNGMYDALNKGFARTAGEIMGWISATDQYHVGGLAVVGSVFRDLPQVEWITGRATGFNEAGMTTVVLDIPHWSRFRFLAGANRYIQQESTFWRRSLWERAGSRVDDSQRYAADFELWVRFFRHAQLYPVDALIGGFRAHADSLGLQDMDRCHRIQQKMIEEELRSAPDRFWLRGFRGLSTTATRIPGIRGLWQRLVMNNLYRMPGPDWPPVIEHRDAVWLLRPR